MNKYLI